MFMIRIIFISFIGLSSIAMAKIGKPQENNREFAIAVYLQLIKNSSENLCFSPYSLFTALAMVSAGAEQQTAQQIIDLLKLQQNSENLHNQVHQ